MKIPGLPKELTAELVGLIAEAQSSITGGDAKHAYVARQLKKLLAAHDMKNVPNWVEAIVEPILVDLIVQFAVAAWKAGRAELASR